MCIKTIKTSYLRIFGHRISAGNKILTEVKYHQYSYVITWFNIHVRIWARQWPIFI